MTTALVITTYNAPLDLKCTLLSVARQTVMPDEIIIADDGSREPTREMIESFRPIFGDRLVHVWQPDEGFQLSRIRNRAIAAAKSDYIIMIDGDMILDRRFIAEHLRNARSGYYVAGLRSMLDPKVSDRLRNNEFRGPLTWYSAPMSLRLHSIHASWLTRFFVKHHGKSVRQLIGANMAFWRDDAIRANGFDESFTQWGEEEREFAIRLNNLGIRRRTMVFSGIQFHLYHPSRKDEESLARNGDRLRATLASGATRCERGIDQYL